jgi:uncharacterized protein YjbI with pentapeptide repeats
MDIYEAYSADTILFKYKKDNQFTDVKILNNNLSGIKLSGAAFADTLIENSYLSNADFQAIRAVNLEVMQSDAKGANFASSVQEDAVYVNNYLIQADFSSSRLYNLSFKNCVGHSMRFNQAHLINTVFYGCEMNKCRFRGSVCMKCSFEPGKKGDLAALTKSDFEGALFIDCSFRGMNLDQINLQGTVFIQCDFGSAQLEEFNGDNMSFIACNFRDALITSKLTSLLKGKQLPGGLLSPF